MEAIIDMRIKKDVNFYNFLRGFFSGGGTGTLIMEINLTQELAIVDQYPLFLVLLDLQKAYENLDHGSLL